MQVRKRSRGGKHKRVPARVSLPEPQIDAELERPHTRGPQGEKNALLATFFAVAPRTIQPRHDLLGPTACLIREMGRLGPMARADEALRVQAVDGVPVVAFPRPANRAAGALLLSEGEIKHDKREVIERVVAAHGGSRRKGGLMG